MSTLDRFGSHAYAFVSVCRVSMVVYCVSIVATICNYGAEPFVLSNIK